MKKLDDKQILAAIRQGAQTRQPDRETEWHPSEEELACFVDGILADDMRDRVEAHLADCRPCRQIALADSLVKSSLTTAAKAEQQAVYSTPQAGVAKAVERVLASLTKIPSPAEAFRMVVEILRDGIRMVESNGSLLPALAPALVRAGKSQAPENAVTRKYEFAECCIRLDIKPDPRGGCRAQVHALLPGTDQHLPQFRATLKSQGMVSESNVGQRGPVAFERLAPDDYTIELSRSGQIIGTIDLSIASGNAS